jgi:hypothetical protein
MDLADKYGLSRALDLLMDKAEQVRKTLAKSA